MLRCKGLRPRVLGSKGNVIMRMEVLSCDLEGEARVVQELVDVVDDAAAVFDCKGSVGLAEVFLHVDDDECGLLDVGHGRGMVEVSCNWE